MHKASKRLLIISHVLVRCHNRGHHLQGGFGRHVDAFAHRFDEVWLLTCTELVKTSPDEYNLRAQNIKVVRVPNIRHPVRVVRYALTLRGMVCAALKLPSLVRQCDVIHPRLPSPIGALGALGAKFTQKPTFVYVAGDREESIRSKGQRLRPLAAMAQRVLLALIGNSLCFTAGDVLCRKFGGPSERVIPVMTTAMDQMHLVEPEVALERAGRQPREILLVGAVGPAKGVDQLLQAVRTLRDLSKDVRVRIIGATHDGGAWLAQQIGSLQLQEAVVHQDHMAWDRMIYEYDKSDLFALPTRAEGVPKVVTEAMARGVPVVATDVGGIPSVIRHGKSGLLVKPGSSGELAHALLTLLDDVELRKKLVLGGLEVARQHILNEVIDGIVGKVCQHFCLTPAHDA